MKKTAVLLLSIFLIQMFLPIAVSASPTVSAKSAVVIDADTGRILYEQDAHTRRGMASTTKIMTALIALEQASPDMLVTVDPRACGVEGSSVYLFAGEKITMETLLYALMLQSANDAAEAIAYAIAGSVEKFADLMNQKADELGLTATHFENPHGLDGETHYTTAYELALIAAYAMKNDSFAEIVSTVKRVVPLHNGEASRLLINHNRLLREYDDIIGVKTGYTKKCGRTLVSAAERDGVRLICVTLNDGNDWMDHRALLDYAYSLYGEVRLSEPISFEIPVCGGAVSSLVVRTRECPTAVLPQGYGEIRFVTEIPRFLYAGIHEGDVVGRVVFYSDGVEIGEAFLYAESDVPVARKKKSFLENIFSFLKKRKGES